MKTSSLKAKGRRWQQEVEHHLKNIFQHLNGNDILSRSMGCQGSDLILSNKALEVLPYDFEMKNQENSKIWADLRQSEKRLHDEIYPVLMLKKNYLKGPLKLGITILPFAHFCSLFVQHCVLSELNHMMSVEETLTFFEEEIHTCNKINLINASKILFESITGLDFIESVESIKSNKEYKFPNNEPLYFYHEKTLNIWKEFTGTSFIFNRNDIYSTIYIAIKASTFYDLLSKIKIKN